MEETNPAKSPEALNRRLLKRTKHMRNKTRLQSAGGREAHAGIKDRAHIMGTDVMGSQGAKQAVVEHKEPRVL